MCRRATHSTCSWRPWCWPTAEFAVMQQEVRSLFNSLGTGPAPIGASSLCLDFSWSLIYLSKYFLLPFLRSPAEWSIQWARGPVCRAGGGKSSPCWHLDKGIRLEMFPMFYDGRVIGKPYLDKLFGHILVRESQSHKIYLCLLVKCTPCSSWTQPS